MTRFATESDIEVCRAIHKRFGTSYYYASKRFPPHIKRRVHSIYAFVRVPDEWVDNPEGLSVDDQRKNLNCWREALFEGLAGKRPERPEMRAFVDTVAECRIPVEEAELFLDAMEMDTTVARYESYQDLRRYMRGSASAVGIMMCYAMCVQMTHDTLSRAMALGEAMQLTNFLRDVREDFERGRLYLPLEDLRAHNVSVDDIAAQRNTEQFRGLMQFEIARARNLFSYSDVGIQRLPDHARLAVLTARLLYAKILDRIEAMDYDVFTRRARTSSIEKLACAGKVSLAGEIILSKLVAAKPAL